MAMDRVEIGCTPYEEDCAQVGARDYDYAKVARHECKAYIAALRKVYGTEPEGAYLSIKSNAHDFGSYYEVVCRYEENNAEAAKYAWSLEIGLKTWAEAGMHAPVLYGAPGGPVLTPEDQWFYSDTMKAIYGDNPPDYTKDTDGAQA
jgi:hypothetical protein